MEVADGVPHAERNSGDAPVDIPLVTTRCIADRFRKIEDPFGM